MCWILVPAMAKTSTRVESVAMARIIPVSSAPPTGWNHGRLEEPVTGPDTVEPEIFTCAMVFEFVTQKTSKSPDPRVATATLLVAFTDVELLIDCQLLHDELEDPVFLWVL